MLLKVDREDEAGGFGESGELFGLGQGGRQRLVADHVDTGLEERAGHRHMQMVRRDDDDGLDAVGAPALLPGHLGVAGIGAVGGDAEIGGRQAGALGVG